MQSVERQIPYSAKSEGVITCFLSLVLLMILALVSVTLESARLAGARFLTENYTRMARDSVMAEYSGVLFDRYHLLAYNSRAGTPEGVQSALAAKTSYYINRNLQADNRMLWEITLQDVTVTEYELLTDAAGAVFREEAVNYMKYRGSAAVVERLLSALGIFQSTQKTTELLETKAATEESLAEIDRCVLELFESVDGFVRDDNGIKQNLWGKVKIKNHFAKQLLAGEPTAESAQINHPELFEAVKAHYINPEDILERMEEKLDTYEDIQEKLLSISQRLAEISTQNLIEHPELLAEKAVLEAEQVFYLGEALIVSQQYQGELRSLQSAVSGSKSAGSKALVTLKLIRTKQKLAESKVLQYEEELLGAVQWLDDSLYSELSEGLSTMKQYVGLNTEGKERIIDIDAMQQTLENNDRVLTGILDVIGADSQEAGEPANERTRIAQLSVLFSGYSHNGLCFDYSGMHLKAEGKSPADSFQELLLGGIASLVLEDEAIVSQSVLTQGELPSSTGDDHEEEKTASEGSLEWTSIGDAGASSTLAAMNRNSPFAGIAEWIAKEGEELTEQVLFLGYLAEHFSNYTEQQEQESVLLYEQEYILCGSVKDKANLYEVIGKLLLVRVIFNLIHVLCDTDKTGVAQETAMGLLGVTGLPILVSIAKFFILFVWAAEAALVETAALLQGKRLALVPTKSNFPVAFSELLLMSGSRIQQKAQAMSDQTGMAFGYSEYLILFLLMQEEEVQSMRSLDLIQENLQGEEPGFRVGQQVCSFAVQGKYLLPELFTTLPFSKRRTGGYVL